MPDVTRTIRRIDVSIYMTFLLGLFFIVEFGLTEISGRVTLETVAPVGLGLTVIAGCVLAYLNTDDLIDEYEKEGEPAPRYLLFLASVMTVLFAVLVVLHVT